MHPLPHDDQLLRIMARRVRDLRHARGLSQQAMADALGVNRAYLSGIERADRNVTLISLVRFADLLGVTPQSLLQELEPSPPDD